MLLDELTLTEETFNCQGESRFLFSYSLHVAKEIASHLVSFDFEPGTNRFHYSEGLNSIYSMGQVVQDDASGSGLIQDSGHFLLPWSSPVSDSASENAAPAQFPMTVPSWFLSHTTVNTAGSQSLRSSDGYKATAWNRSILLTKEFINKLWPCSLDFFFGCRHQQSRQAKRKQQLCMQKTWIGLCNQITCCLLCILAMLCW